MNSNRHTLASHCPRFVLRPALACALLAAGFTSAFAQPVIAPTPEKSGDPKGENIAGYNIVQSFETGYRWLNFGSGNFGKYQSDVNFEDGFRLLGSSLSAHSRNGKGKFFDDLVLNTQGLGNDPYQMSTFRVAKNGWYRYDLNWRQSDYINPALTIASGNHQIATVRQWHDQDLVLRPQSKFKILAGYSRNRQNGPAFSTLFWPDFRTADYYYISNLQRVRNEYRLGTEFEVAKTRIHILRGWEYFKDDSVTPLLPATLTGATTPPTDRLQSLRRDEPYHGASPYWRVNLHNEASRKLLVDGRFTHTDGQRNFISDEYQLGLSGGAPDNRQIVVGGNARRPVTTGNLTVSFLPTERLTIANHTSVYSIRMEGDSTYGELYNGAREFSSVRFQYLGFRTVANTTDADLRLTKQIGIHSGYHYSTREIGSQEYEDSAAPTSALTRDLQTNRLHAGQLGLRLQPVKQLRLTIDGEIGRNDRPFTGVSERDYHAVNGRAVYRTKQFQISGRFGNNYNFNSNNLFVHSSRNRIWSGDFTWSGNARLQLDAGYSKLHLDTITGLAYFLGRTQVTTDRSFYVSNLHQLRLGATVVPHKRVSLYAGYHRVQDTGDGRDRSTNLLAANPYIANPTLASGFVAAQAFPLSYDTPMARASVEIAKKLRLNIGWQYYNYKEVILAIQDYQAHTGFVSVTWSF